MQIAYIRKKTYKACRRSSPAVSQGKMFFKWLFKKTIFHWYFKPLSETVKTLQFLKKHLYCLMFLRKQLSKFSQLTKLYEKQKSHLALAEERPRVLTVLNIVLFPGKMYSGFYAAATYKLPSNVSLMKISVIGWNYILLLPFLKNIYMEREVLESLPNISSHEGILSFIKTEERHMKCYF